MLLQTIQNRASTSGKLIAKERLALHDSDCPAYLLVELQLKNRNMGVVGQNEVLLVSPTHSDVQVIIFG